MKAEEEEAEEEADDELLLTYPDLDSAKQVRTKKRKDIASSRAVESSKSEVPRRSSPRKSVGILESPDDSKVRLRSRRKLEDFDIEYKPSKASKTVSLVTAAGHRGPGRPRKPLIVEISDSEWTTLERRDMAFFYEVTQN